MLGLTGWLGGLAGDLLAGRLLLALLLGLGTGLVLLARRAPARRRLAPTAAALLLVLTATATAAVVRREQVGHNPVAALARDGAVVRVEATVTSDPRPVPGRYGEQVLLRLTVHRVTGRGHTHRLATPVLVLADDGWSGLRLGERVLATGRLEPARDTDLAAVLHPSGAPETRAPPGAWWRGADAVRRSLRSSVAHRPAEQRALVPALVDGDDAGVDEDLAADFRTTGLTHLLAVSGTNLTLRRRVPAGAGALGRGPGAVARRGRCRWASSGSCCSPAPSRACCAPRSWARWRCSRWAATAGSGGAGRSGVAVVVLLLVQPALATSRRVRAVGAGDRRDPAARAGVARRPGPVAAALAGRGDRRSVGRPAGLHAAGRGHLRAGQPGRGAGQPAGRPGVGPATVLGLAGALARPGLAGRRRGGRHARGVVRRLDRRWSPGVAPPCPPPRSTGGPACCRWCCSPR